MVNHVRMKTCLPSGVTFAVFNDMLRFRAVAMHAYAHVPRGFCLRVDAFGLTVYLEDGVATGRRAWLLTNILARRRMVASRLIFEKIFGL